MIHYVGNPLYIVKTILQLEQMNVSKIRVFYIHEGGKKSLYMMQFNTTQSLTSALKRDIENEVMALMKHFQYLKNNWIAGCVVCLHF